MTLLPEHFTAFWVLLSFWLVYIVFKLARFGSREKFLPPGPPTWPIIGNAHLMVGKDLGKRFMDLSKLYGPVFSLKVGKGTMIVISSRAAVHDLVDKRSSLYAGKPLDEQVHASMKDENLSQIDPNADWRMQRKITVRFLAPKRLDGPLARIAEAEIVTLLHDLVNDSKDFSKHLDRAVASSASIALFGQRAKYTDDFWARGSYDALEALNSAITPGSYLPTTEFPIFKWIPKRWLSSSVRAENCFRTMTDIWTEARKRVEARRDQGDRRECLMDEILDDDTLKSGAAFEGTKLANFVGSVMEAAGETTTLAMRTNIMFLAKHPWVQEKAQKQLDAVCGTDRVPTFADFKDAPYINCIMKEGLRIRPVIPTGLPRRCIADNWYEGMLIPKDSTIWVASWALSHTQYENSQVYDPDRYLNHPALAFEYASSSDYQNRDHYTYGAGRRICAGMPLAERMQWRMLACLLWAFRIEPGIDEKTGEKIDLDLDAYENKLVAGPVPFQVRFIPRSEAHVRTIEREFEAASGLLRSWE